MEQGSAADLSGVAQSSCFSRVLYIAYRGAADLVEYCRSTSTVKQDVNSSSCEAVCNNCSLEGGVTAVPVKQDVKAAPVENEGCPSCSCEALCNNCSLEVGVTAAPVKQYVTTAPLKWV